MPATGKNLGCRLLDEFVDDAANKNQRFLAEGLAEALNNHLCASIEVTPWDGLMLTFIQENSPLLAATTAAVLPAFELATLGSTWVVEKPDGTSVCEQSSLHQVLVGQRVADWKLGAQLDLTIVFSSQTKMTFTPGSTAGEAWSLSNPDQYLMVFCNGQVQRVTPRAGKKKEI